MAHRPGAEYISSRDNQVETLPSSLGITIINALNPIEELYNLYSDKEETLRIMEILDGESDIKDGLADLFIDL